MVIVPLYNYISVKSISFFFVTLKREVVTFYYLAFRIPILQVLTGAIEEQALKLESSCPHYDP